VSQLRGSFLWPSRCCFFLAFTHGQAHELKRALFREAPQTLFLAIEKNKEEVLAKNLKNKILSVISGQPRRQAVAHTTGDRRPDVAKVGRISAWGDSCPSRSCLLLLPFFFLLPHFSLSLPNMFSLSMTPYPLAISSFSSQFFHKITPFYFIFFTFCTHTTLMFHHFFIFFSSFIQFHLPKS